MPEPAHPGGPQPDRDAGRPAAFPATIVLIAINVIVYLVEIAPAAAAPTSSIRTIYDFGGLWGPAVHEGGDWWRTITSGFVHFSIIHIGFNMYLLFILGRLLEPAIGTPASSSSTSPRLLAGSFLALAADPGHGQRRRLGGDLRRRSARPS